ncbi:hypothetical protein C484_10561 [Natrialba taiwanensis DSM 12281]|uniref:Uncharacterized protein n=2 Tax=Natrialba taiwanensis TaxID=160846 RepID=M0A298_9EURY|nr:hypothetical protein C484_10561 [Natrialba taiwanensis DSM 12281]
MHAGTSSDGKSHEGNDNAVGNDGGAEEGNTNSVSHGAYAEQSNLYNDVFTNAERDIADDIFEDYKNRYLEAHGDIPTGHELRLFKLSVNAVTEIRVENWATDRPEVLDSGTPHIDSEQHFTEGGQRYFKYKKSPSLAAKKTLSNENRMWLKDLGLLEDPQSQTANSVADLAEVWESDLTD